jgi:long-subunit acyl-CoA synthetase (AMP-forming)
VPKSGRQHELAAAIARANRRLPGYAQIGHFISIESPFTVGNDLLTGNGRVRREQVWERYRMHLEALYEEDMNGVL